MDFSDLEKDKIELPERPELPYIGAREDDPRFQGIARARGYIQNGDRQDGSRNDQYHRPKRVNYTHEAMADYIIANPSATHGQIADVFDVSVAWVGRIINSDGFQAYLAARRTELTDPILAHTIEDQLRGLVSQSVEVITEKLEKTRNPEIALQALELGSKALGFGARDRALQINNSFVVALPSPAPSSQAWADHYAPQPKVIESRPLGSTVTFDPLSQPAAMKPAED